MKTILLFTFIFFLFACKGDTKKRSLTEKQTFFDSLDNKNMEFLNANNLSEFNDSAKWLLYTIHCDDSSTRGKGRYYQLLEKVPLSFLELKLTYARKDNDTLWLLYSFMYNDSVMVEQDTVGNIITNGIVFNVRNKRMLGYAMGEGIYNVEGDPKHRRVNSLQPEVILFIKNNNDKLDPWFRAEAKRRRIIE